jgi:hypothetical protein
MRGIAAWGRRRLTYANVMATVAVFVAVGGSAYAASKVTGRDVVNESLTGRDIAHRSLDLGHIRGHDSVHSSEEAEALSGSSQFLFGRRQGPSQPQIGVVERYGDHNFGSGRLTSSSSCTSEEVVVDGEAWHGDLAGSPEVTIDRRNNRVRAVGYARDDEMGGYVMAIAYCMALRGTDVGPAPR